MVTGTRTSAQRPAHGAADTAVFGALPQQPNPAGAQGASWGSGPTGEEDGTRRARRVVRTQARAASAEADAETGIAELRERCAAILTLAPLGSAISHESAAFLHGLWLPRPYLPGGPVHVTRPAGTSRLRRRGFIDHDSARGLRHYEDLYDIRIVSAADTWADLAGVCTLPDLVALADSVARRPEGIEPLLATLARRKFYGCRHTRVMERALQLVRTGSASYMESRARVLFLTEGLPEPELNADVPDKHGGWLANVDFLWRQARLIVEYQSETHHGDRTAREADERRRRLLEAAGYRVVLITASTVFERRYADELIDALRTTLDV
ncbi:DUF559 domain-containing protein [Gephyromycinifex aptenodytis]|uniref:DUF559 domain-containing protein n=1 Tax=Gephyromycinifex aptenodytis TaxID=2716227 RepID=UPI001444ED79|nr:DUF559 domain-containing protein [Gephyromycinifex aptenodytis]